MIQRLSHIPHPSLKISSRPQKRQDPLAQSQRMVLAQDLLEAPLKQAQNPSCRTVLKRALPKIMGQNRPQPVNLSALIKQINAPNWNFFDGVRTDKALTHLIAAQPTNAEAILWRGVLARIMGYDARNDLNAVLAQDPTNRMARLNLALLPITCRQVRMEEGSLEKSIDIINHFLEHNPQDYFAHLIKVALAYLDLPLFSKTIEALEDIYLQFPRRASTTAMMAAVLQRNQRHQSASDFASETLTIEPRHPLARNIVLKNSLSENSKFDPSQYFYCPNSAGADYFDLVFMAPHAHQDP